MSKKMSMSKGFSLGVVPRTLVKACAAPLFAGVLALRDHGLGLPFLSLSLLTDQKTCLALSRRSFWLARLLYYLGYPMHVLACLWHVNTCQHLQSDWYGVATISRLLKNIGRFCKRALQRRPIFCKETYGFKEPTNRSHPIGLTYCRPLFLYVFKC